MRLATTDVSWRAGGTLVVDGVSLALESGRVLGLLGPNGSGKSSLLRLLAGLRPSATGMVALDDRPLAGWGRRELARRVAVMDQHGDTEIELTVRDVVTLGRVPHRGAWGTETAADRAAVARAAATVGVADLLDRRWQVLSGGERQRVQIARALAQEPRLLLLDEPSNHLDVNHQLEILGVVRRLPTTTVVALHDLNLAAQFCDEIVVLDRGRVRAAGPPAQVLTPELIAGVYRVTARVTHEDGRVWIRFLAPREG